MVKYRYRGAYLNIINLYSSPRDNIIIIEKKLKNFY